MAIVGVIEKTPNGIVEHPTYEVPSAMATLQGIKIRCDVCKTRYPVPDPDAYLVDTANPAEGPRHLRASEEILQSFGWLRVPWKTFTGKWRVRMVCPQCVAAVICLVVGVRTIRQGLSDA
jgi:hypothetical protein